MKTTVLLVLSCSAVLLLGPRGTLAVDKCPTGERSTSAFHTCRLNGIEERCVLQCWLQEMELTLDNGLPDIEKMKRETQNCPELQKEGWIKEEFHCFIREGTKVTENTCDGFKPMVPCVP